MHLILSYHKNKGGDVMFFLDQKEPIGAGAKKSKSTPQVTLPWNQVTAYIKFHNSFAGKTSCAAVDKRSWESVSPRYKVLHTWEGLARLKSKFQKEVKVKRHQ